MKKKSKILYRLLNIAGILLIIIGLTMVGLDYYQAQQEKNQIANEIASWNSLPISGDDETPADTLGSNNTLDLDQNAIWGTIQIPDLSVTAPISITKGDWTLLRKYVVPFEGADLPSVKNGTFSLASHWGNSNCAYCYFRNIKSLKVGSQITIADRDSTYTYEVYEAPKVIDYTDTSDLKRISGQTTLMMVTCVTAKDPRRTVVLARLVSSTPKTATTN